MKNAITYGVLQKVSDRVHTLSGHYINKTKAMDSVKWFRKTNSDNNNIFALGQFEISSGRKLYKKALTEFK